MEEASTLSPVRLSPRRKSPQRSLEVSSPLSKRGVSGEKEGHEPIPFHGKFIPSEHLREIGGGLLEEIELGENKDANDWLKTLKGTEKPSTITSTGSHIALKQFNGQTMNSVQHREFPLSLPQERLLMPATKIFPETDPRAKCHFTSS